jgi:hypothetical protein
MADFAGARQSADARLEGMGKGLDGNMPLPPAAPAGPEGELEALLAQVDPMIADQIRSLVAEMVGGGAPPPPMEGNPEPPPPGGF